MKDYFLKPSPATQNGYLDYLLKRLTDFRAAGRSFGQKHHGQITIQITRKIVQSQLAWPLNDAAHFTETCDHLKAKIDETILGRRNAARGTRSYHSFEEHGKPKGKTFPAPEETGTPNHAPVEEMAVNAPALESFSQTAPSTSGARPPAMLPEENSGTRPSQPRACIPEPLVTAHETPAVSAPQLTRRALALGAKRAGMITQMRQLRDEGTLDELAAMQKTSAATLCRLKSAFGHLPADQINAVNCAGKFARSGRKPFYLPTAYELAAVRSVYVRLDESNARGRGLGSSRVTAYRLVAKSDDEQISPQFRTMVLKRKHKTVPPSWARLLDTPASVLAHVRDKRSTMAAYVNTPRGRNFINAAGEEIPLRAGTIFEADDGTFNFYAHIPWPFGGDKCSDRFGVKLGRWQLLAVVDARWEFCPHYHVIARNLSSYRGEDSMALLGDAMFAEGRPEIWRLERGSWESKIVRDALELSGVHTINAWHSKQKSAVERFFDRLWTPLSLMPGHAGRDRDRFKQTTGLALSCQDGRQDPRENFLSLDAAMPKVEAAIAFVNGEPIESKTWGRWTPQERYESQIAGHPLPTLDESLRIFFSREQRTWTVRGCCVGGSVEGPLIKFPVWFQCPELWEFEGCKVKCFFDPYAAEVRGTLVLQDEWRSCKPGHVIARDVPALDLPPQAVLQDGWTNDERERSLAIRKAISKAVRTEARNWRGGRVSEARDGLGSMLVRDRGQRTEDRGLTSDLRSPTSDLRPPSSDFSRCTFPAAPLPRACRGLAVPAADDPELREFLAELSTT